MDETTETGPVTETTGAQSEPAASPATGGLTTPKDGDTLFGSIGGEAEGEPSGETEQTQTQQQNDLILGKFKTQDDLIKSYQQLETKLKSRAPSPPDQYDVEGAFKAAGITPKDRADETAKQEYAVFEQSIREQGFTQEQLNWMSEFGGNWIREQMQKFGPQVDMDAERSALSKEWGGETEQTANEVKEWVKANLPPAVVNKPLLMTAEGWKFLRNLMKVQRGPVPLSNARAPSKSRDDLALELQQIFNNPDYGTSTPTGQALQNKALKISDQMSRFT